MLCAICRNWCAEAKKVCSYLRISVQFVCNFDHEKAEVVENQRLPLEKGVQDESRTHTPNWALPPQSSASTNSATWTKKRAKDGTRTRDPDLGKVVLYQLSYFRSQFSPLCRGAFVNCGAKI